MQLLLVSANNSFSLTIYSQVAILITHAGVMPVPVYPDVPSATSRLDLQAVTAVLRHILDQAALPAHSCM